jgi:dTDP-4-dehydrorhamnose 3,5-epimerase
VKVRPLTIEGAYEITPALHGDDRGVFLEWYRADTAAATVGHPFELAQANISVSVRGSVRGIHFADVPPGQAKYITCVAGAVLDVVVDIRVGSPTYGQWEAVQLDETERRTVHLVEGLGHGFCAVSDRATIAYLCSTSYQPAREHTVHPLDPALDIHWPTDTPVLSARDAAAPSLAQARAAGILPDYRTCQSFVRSRDRRVGSTNAPFGGQ